MDRFWTTFPGTCDVCGGEGVGNLASSVAAWEPGSTVAHRNPSVCRDNLRRERERLEREKASA